MLGKRVGLTGKRNGFEFEFIQHCLKAGAGLARPRPCKWVKFDDEPAAPQQLACGSQRGISQPSMSMTIQDGSVRRSAATSSSVVMGTLTRFRHCRASGSADRDGSCRALRSRAGLQPAWRVANRQPENLHAIADAVQPNVLGQQVGCRRVGLEREHAPVRPTHAANCSTQIPRFAPTFQTSDPGSTRDARNSATNGSWLSGK